MNENPNRAEAERLLGVAEKLLQNRDLTGSRDFAILAQETEPLLEGTDQILAVSEVLISSQKRINNHHDWYSILQLQQRNDDQDLIKKQYRKFALLLHPDKNKYPFADQAFKLVADAWAVLSDSNKKVLYDNELSLFSKVDLPSSKLPVRRSQRPVLKKTEAVNINANVNNSGENTRSGKEDVNRVKMTSFWTTCPYCYMLYEYPRVYEDCCLRCPNCERAFHAALLPFMPPLVPGSDAYYCYWSMFPLGFVLGGSGPESGAKNAGSFPNWMPNVFGGAGDKNGVAPAAARAPEPTPTPTAAPTPVSVTAGSFRVAHAAAEGTAVKRKRGRPRKN